MITIRKLASLPRKTRLRKTVTLLEAFERDCLSNREVDERYLRDMAALIRDDERLGERLREAAGRAAGAPGAGRSEETSGRQCPAQSAAGTPQAPRALCRIIDDLRNALLSELGQEPAEWDLLLPEGGALDAAVRRLREFFVYLEDMRSPYNVGAVFRTAESFGVRKVYLSPDTPRPDHPRAARSSMGAVEVVPWEVCTLEEARAEAPRIPVFALETGGTPLEEAELPEPGLVVLGSEELGVSAASLAVAERSTGRVSISTGGAKASLNVAVAFGILAHEWWHRGTKKPAE
jgi:TrmH family RNA methyltransferase